MSDKTIDLWQVAYWLDQQTTRKAGSWSEVAHIKVNKTTQRVLLSHLPILSVTKDEMPQFPCEDITGGSPAKRFILQVIKEDGDQDTTVAEYYINTEGYDYARYACRID
jgi:hypothetical protein